MKLNLRVLALALILWCSACTLNQLEKPFPAPIVRLSMWDGEYTSLTKWTGRPIALAFWATWCSTSSRRIQDFDQLAAEYIEDLQDLPDAQAASPAVFIAVNLNNATDREVVQSFIERKKLEHVQHAFSGNDLGDEAFLALPYRELPAFYFIDAQGQVLGQGSAVELLRQLLGR